MKGKKPTISAGALALALTLAASLPATAQGNAGNPTVLPPGSKPYGLSYAEWSVKWWQWVFSLPATNSPILDTGDCSASQSGPVWFLAGSFSPGSVTRACTIPAGKALFFPLANAWADNTGCPTYTTFTAAELEGFAVSLVDGQGVVTCTIDGVPVQGVASTVGSAYRVGPQVFSYTLASTDNILANGIGPLFSVDLTCIPNGTTVAPAAEDGVYLMVAPLSAGHHAIHFSVAGFIEVTYSVTVLK